MWMDLNVWKIFKFVLYQFEMLESFLLGFADSDFTEFQDFLSL